MTLVIAAHSFSQPSETFVAAHARTIWPENSVLICQDGRGAEALGFPVLSNIDPYPEPKGLFERMTNSARFRWRVKVDRALSGVSEKRVREFLKQHKVTHCLAEFGPTGCLLRRAIRNAGVQLYVHFHGYDATSLPREPGWLSHYRRLFADATGVIAPSQFILEKLAVLGCPRQKLYVSSCGIDPEHFTESRRDHGQILAVGRFVDKKAPLSTIRAFAEAAARVPEAHLHMVGDGPLFSAAQDLVVQLALIDRITFHGSQPHEAVRALLGRVSFFVQHSVTAPNGDTEGLPVAILEAMASGLPVVSTRHSGIPEVVSEGETGFLVDERDVGAMGQSILRLLENPDLAMNMGRAGAPRVRREFSHDATAARLRSIMEIKP